MSEFVRRSEVKRLTPPMLPARPRAAADAFSRATDTLESALIPVWKDTEVLDPSSNLTLLKLVLSAISSISAAS